MRNLLGKFLVGLLTLVVTASIVFPVYWMAVTSGRTFAEMFRLPPTLWPTKWDFSPYMQLWQAGKIFLWVRNTLVVAGGTVLLNLICAVPAAYAISRWRFRFRNLVLLLVLSTQMVSQPLIIVPLFIVFKELNLIDTPVSLILSDALLTVPLATWILTGFFEKIPRELEEAALVDGSSRWVTFLRVALPIAMPVVLVVSVLTFFDTWNEFIFGVTFISDQAKWVASVGLASFRGQFQMDWRVIMSYALVLTIPPMLLYVVSLRRIASGLASVLVLEK